MMRRHSLVLLALLLAAGAGSSQENVRRVRFARGASSATVESSVIRGERDLYLLRARAGQRLQASIVSLEDNAVFHVLTPRGAALGGHELRRWSGVLPATGDYRIEVGGTRGNATYRLTLSVR